jgi:hypothetical protein
VSFTDAALILAWIILVLLVFAMAGMLRQISELRASLRNLAAQGPMAVVGARRSEFAGESPGAVLVVDPGCGLCRPIYEAFLANDAATILRRSVLSQTELSGWPVDTDVPVRIDEELVRELDVPWSPALLVTDRDGMVVTAGPLGSAEEVQERISEVGRELAEQVKTGREEHV